MGKSKSPSLPPAPTIDPIIGQTAGQLQGLGTRLTNFDFTGNLSPLADTINPNPETSKLALQYAQGVLNPTYQDTIDQIRNTAANTGSLQSSTFDNALARAGQNLDSGYQSIVANASLADAQQANQNRIGLFGTGLNTLNSAGGLSNNINQFNLENYQNQVAASLAGQKQQNGGFLGGLMGAGGGALAGLALAPFTGGSSLLAAGIGGLAGGLGGGFGTPSTGGQLLGTGAGLFGSMTPTGQAPYQPGSSASNNPFQSIQGSLGSQGNAIQNLIKNLSLSGNQNLFGAGIGG